MEFYKLFQKIHHNTGFDEMYRHFREIMLPEQCAEEKKKTEMLLKNLFKVPSIIMNKCKSDYF